MLRVIKALWTTSLLTGMQYRGDFLYGVFMASLFAVWSVVPLLLVFEHTDAIEGWRYPEATLVMAFFLGLKGLVDDATSKGAEAIVVNPANESFASAKVPTLSLMDEVVFGMWILALVLCWIDLMVSPL